MHVDQPDVVRQQHAHHRLRGVCAEYTPLEPRLLRQVGKARRVVQMEVCHQEEVDLIGRTTSMGGRYDWTEIRGRSVWSDWMKWREKLISLVRMLREVGLIGREQ